MLIVESRNKGSESIALNWAPNLNFTLKLNNTDMYKAFQEATVFSEQNKWSALDNSVISPCLRSSWTLDIPVTHIYLISRVIEQYAQFLCLKNTFIWTVHLGAKASKVTVSLYWAKKM